MPSTRTGHFVQIWRPVYEAPGGGEYVDVAGRTVGRTVSPGLFRLNNGWTVMSRELPFRRARRFAKAYARAGFPTRVVLENNNGSSEIVLELRGH